MRIIAIDQNDSGCYYCEVEHYIYCDAELQYVLILMFTPEYKGNPDTEKVPEKSAFLSDWKKAISRLSPFPTPSPIYDDYGFDDIVREMSKSGWIFKNLDYIKITQ